jgi:hypothetical protein
MNLIKAVRTFVLVVAISSCATQPQFHHEASGRIAFGVTSFTSNSHSFNTNLGIKVFLISQKTGEQYTIYFPFETGRRVEFLEGLPIGHYLVEKYTAYMGRKPHFEPYITLDPAVTVEVIEGKTTLFPLEVNMSAIYPIGGLIYMSDESFWNGLIQSE